MGRREDTVLLNETLRGCVTDLTKKLENDVGCKFRLSSGYVKTGGESE